MKPQVELIDYTGCGRHDYIWHAANILIYTKQTRLKMTAEAFRKVQNLTTEEKMEELNYMATTIPSSWEFVDLTFLISNVTRACAQQMTRTRTASYAMESQRVVDKSGATVSNPCAPGSFEYDTFDMGAQDAIAAYNQVIEDGATREQARGLLPMNTTCTLIAKYNLRSLVELIRARKSMRTQSEYGDIVRQMEQEVLAVWPWASTFFRSKNETALQLLTEVVNELGLETGTGLAWKVAKAQDLIR
jgi:flavin-dependent thymidylate synthase